MITGDTWCSCQAKKQKMWGVEESEKSMEDDGHGDLPDPVIKPKSPALAGRFFTSEPLGKPGH